MAFFQRLNAFSQGNTTYAGDFDLPRYTPISYLTNSDVFTAVNVISNDIATNPIRLESQNVNHIADNQFDDLNYLLNVKPNDYMTARTFKYAMAANLLLNGNAYAKIYKTKKGEILSLSLLQPSWVTVFQDTETGKVVYEVQDGTSKPYKLQVEDVLHVKFLTTNALVGASPLYALSDELRMQKGGNNLLTDFFNSGVNGSAVIKINKGALAPDARASIRNEWLKANGPEGNKSRVMVLDNTEDYQPLEIDTNVLKIVNSNNYTTKQIAKAFGIPLSRLGLENAHSSITQANLDYIQNSLDHYFSMFTSELDSKLLTYSESKEFHFEFDVSRLMTLDTEKNIQLSMDLYRQGLLDDTETRRRIGYAPYDDNMSSKRIVISNMVPIANIESNFPNNVIVGNAYDDSGKPIDKQKMSKSKEMQKQSDEKISLKGGE